MNITAHGSSVVNVLGFGTFNNHQQQPPLAAKHPLATIQQPQTEEFKESNDQENIPSDLLAHYYRQQTTCNAIPAKSSSMVLLKNLMRTASYTASCHQPLAQSLA